MYLNLHLEVKKFKVELGETLSAANVGTLLLQVCQCC